MVNIPLFIQKDFFKTFLGGVPDFGIINSIISVDLFYHPGVPLEYPHQGSDFAIGDAPMSMFQVLRLHEKDMINLTKSKVHSVRLTVLNDFGWHPWIAEWLVGYFHHRQEGCIGVKTMLPNHSDPRKQTLEPKNHPFGKGKSSSKPSLLGSSFVFQRLV